MPPHPASPSNTHHTIQSFLTIQRWTTHSFHLFEFLKCYFPRLTPSTGGNTLVIIIRFSIEHRIIEEKDCIWLNWKRVKFSLGIPIDYGRSRTGEISIIGIVEETPSAANVPANWLREWRHRRLPGGIYKYEWLSFSADFSRNYLTSRRYT